MPRIRHPKDLPVALTIAGSDSGGGAGIQADLKTFAALGVHGASVVTCVTAQNPRRVRAIQLCDPKIVRQQIEAVLEELPPAAVKTGMLFSGGIVRVVVRFFKHRHRPPLIVDPVMVATSGRRLIESAALKALQSQLLPLATLVTPNLGEAGVLAGRRIRSIEDMRSAAREIKARYGCATLVKGGHLPGGREAADIFYDGTTELLLTAPFVRGVATHGTGCVYSAAITGWLALGCDLPPAVERAKQYVTRAIAGTVRAGGHAILNHFFRGLCLLVCLGTLAVAAAFAQTPPAPATKRFRFREPNPASFRIEESHPGVSGRGRSDWVTAWPDNGSSARVEFGRRVALQLKPGADLREVLQGSSLKLSRSVAANFFVLEAAAPAAAMTEAQRLAALPEVLVSCPVRRRSQIRLHATYAARPNDTYFFDQWNLEDRDANGTSLGVDLNLREAWPVTRGEGTVIALADDGVELTHPELVERAANDLHFNFTDDPDFGGTTNALPVDTDDNHATAVAGLALAEGNNRRGMSGIAPLARLASWKIFIGPEFRASDEQMMDMFQYRSNLVSVENHSWGNSDPPQLAPTALESVGLANAIEFGRAGRGVIMVRSAGNGRAGSMNANDDGYANDPRAICVAAVRRDGRVADYSNPGACLLVAAPGGDSDIGLFTTDRQGSAAGFNTGTYTNDMADYVFSSDIKGTSFAAPQISGLAALLLAANPNLNWRDVQQVLILSARHFDLADPDVKTNAAGFRVSHNVGFGVPDAGRAVALARTWVNRPAPTTVTLTATNEQSIPDDGLRVVITNLDPGQTVSSNLADIPAMPGTGRHADVPTAVAPVVDVGLATNAIAANLSGRGALIQRGPAGDFADNRNYFDRKIQRAADAGAAFAIVYNNTNGDARMVMGGTDFVPIPAVFIGQNQGEALRSYVQTAGTARASIQLNATSYSFNVTNTLICEHVSVRVQTDHPRRGDLRITLLSPQGTRSVLQALNSDDTAGPADWTYHSTLHYGESSAGAWTVYVSDEQPLNTGSVQSVALGIVGVPITDTDHDGLDDDWEMAYFGSLSSGPQDDPDGDGCSNAREQVLGTDPAVANPQFTLDLSAWDERLARLSWPGVTNRHYEVLAGTNLGVPLTLVTNLPGRFPEIEWFSPYTNVVNQFFRLRAISP